MSNPPAEDALPVRHVAAAAVELRAEPENGLVLRELVRAADAAGTLSLTWVRLDGEHRRLRSVRTHRTYYVLDGSFSFTVEGRPAGRLGAGDVLVLEPGAAYDFSGSGAYLVINSPGFRPGDDEYLDGAAQRT